MTHMNEPTNIWIQPAKTGDLTNNFGVEWLLAPWMQPTEAKKTERFNGLVHLHLWMSLLLNMGNLQQKIIWCWKDCRNFC